MEKFMSDTLNKIDFAIIIKVKNANPNGDPLNGNRPRVDNNGYGEISDVCLKRKIRDRLLIEKESIYVQSDEKKVDNMKNLKERAESPEFGLGKDGFSSKNPDEISKKACARWYDVRAFGQVFAFKPKDKKEDKQAGVSIAIRGPITIQPAFSLEPVSITSIQITKSVSNEAEDGKGSDTMGMKHRIDNGVYVTYGVITPQLANRTGFNFEDADKFKSILPKLFEGDASTARPEGSMIVDKIVWWSHNCSAGQYSSAKVHKTLKDLLDSSGGFDEETLKTSLVDLVPEIISGF